MSARWGWDDDMQNFIEPFWEQEIDEDQANLYGFPEGTRFIEVDGVLDDPGEEEQAVPHVVRCYKDSKSGYMLCELYASELTPKAFDLCAEGLNS